MASSVGEWEPALPKASSVGEWEAVPKEDFSTRVEKRVGNALNQFVEGTNQNVSLARGLLTGAGDIAVTPVQMLQGETYTGKQPSKTPTSDLLTSLGWKPNPKYTTAETVGEIVAPGSGATKLATHGLTGIGKFLARNKNIIPDVFGKRVGAASEELSKVGSAIEKEAGGKLTEQLSTVEKEGQAKIAQIEKEGSEASKKFNENAQIANSAAQKQKQIIDNGIKDLSGVETKPDIAGVYKATPKTLDDIGANIRARVDRTFNLLKDARSARAEQNFGIALNEAKNKEASGQLITQTKDFAHLNEYFDKKLSIVTDPTLRNELTMLKKALTEGVPIKLSEGEKRVFALRHNTTIDKVPDEINLPPSFEGFEIMRRRIGDSAFGAPVEGYKSISKDMAKDIYEIIGKSMREFSPGFDKYLADYKRMSEPLNVFSNKVGKAFVGAEEKGDYYKVDAQKIVNKAFESREGYRSLVEALGGNLEESKLIAKQWFSNQLHNKSPQEIKSFLEQDKIKSLLNEMPSIREYLQQKIVIPMLKLERKQTALGEVGKQAEKSAETITKETEKSSEVARKETEKALQNIQRLRSDLTKDVTDIENASPKSAFATFERKLDRLKESGLISEQQLAEYKAKAENLTKISGEADKNKHLARVYVRITLGAAAAYESYHLTKAFGKQ